MDLKHYEHTNTWFYGSEIRYNLLNHLSQNDKNNILEIGSHEGMSSCCFSDNLVSHPDSSLDCVDPFDIGDETTPVNEETEKRFLRNIAQTSGYSKFKHHKLYSDDFFAKNTKTFNLIYIDGSHLLQNITRDMQNAFNVLQVNGIMWMDDYGASTAISKRMDEIVQKFGDQCKVIHRGYQLAIRKTTNKI